jgi:hypothetical protein
MMNIVLMLGVPLVVGGLAGATGRRRSVGLFAHAGRAFVAFIATVVLLYTGGFVLGLAAAGVRISPSALLESVSFLFSRYGVLYLIVSMVITLPLTVIGYVAGALLGGPGGESRAETR